MIIVIASMETNERTGQKEMVASHGIDERTGERHVLPPEHPTKLGARFCAQRGEWLLPG